MIRLSGNSTKTYIIAGIVIAALVAFGAPKLADLFRPNADQQLGAGKQIVKEAKADFVKLDTVFVHDTVKLRKELVRHDTLLVEKRITDTVWVKEYIASSEATIGACTDALGTCGLQKAALERINRGLELELVAERRKQPSRFAVWRDRVFSAGVGYGACRAEGVLRP